MEGDGVLRLWKLESLPVFILSCNLNILIRFEENIKHQMYGVWRLPRKEGKRRSMGWTPRLRTRGERVEEEHAAGEAGLAGNQREPTAPDIL